jgi:hypothetical protein
MTKVSAQNSFSLAGSSKEAGSAGFRAIAPGYFAAMGIPLRRGRLPESGEDGAALINQTMARQYWPNSDPIGTTIETPRVVRTRLQGGWDQRLLPEQFQIVGIVGDVRHLTLQAEPRPEMFLPYSRMATDSLTLVLHSSMETGSLARAARKEIWAIDPDQPLAAVRTIGQLIGADVAGSRFVLMLLAVFAGVALALATAGIFAVVSHAVAQRSREIGIRMALGAGVAAAVRTVVLDTALWIGAGILLGTAGTLAGGRLLRSYLYVVRPGDPTALAAAATALALLAGLAAWLPARAAARGDPAVTLRVE